MYKAFLIKYAEIGLKGKNRHVFENILRDQIQYHLDQLGAFEVTREQGRIFVSCPEVYDFDETIEELQKVFGVAGICPVVVVESTDWDVITEEALKYVDEFYEDMPVVNMGVSGNKTYDILKNMNSRI